MLGAEGNRHRIWHRKDSLMTHIRTVAATLLLAMGVIHIAATPFLPWAEARAAMDFAGTGVATALVGLLNLIGAYRGDVGRLTLSSVNAAMALFLGVFVLVAFEPPVGVAWALTLVVSIGAWSTAKASVRSVP